MDDNKCGICIQEYDNNQCLKVPLHMASNNEYHFTCIRCFFHLKNKVCPYCKSKELLFHSTFENYLKDTIYGACMEGNKEKAINLLNNKYYNEIDFIDKFNRTALIWACMKKLPEVALELIKLGPEYCLPQQIDNDGDTVLILACIENLPEVALELIKLGPEHCLPQQINDEGDTALIYACRENLPEVALELIKLGPEHCLPQQINDEGDTALILACRVNLPVALKLIELGPEHCLPHQVDSNGESALDYATMNNLTNVIEKLSNFDRVHICKKRKL